MGTHTSGTNIDKEKNALINYIRSEDYSESVQKRLIELVKADAAEKKAAAKKKAAKEKAAKEEAAKEAVVTKAHSEKEKFDAIKDYFKSLLNHPELEEKDKDEILGLITLMDKLDIEIEKIDRPQTDKNNVYHFANQALLKIETLSIRNTSENISTIFNAVEQEALKQEALKQETLKQEALKQEALKQEALKQETLKQEALKQEVLKQEALKQEALKQEAERKFPATFSEKGESFSVRPDLTSEENHTAKTGTTIAKALDKIALQLNQYNTTLNDEQDKKTNSCSFFTFDTVKFAFGKHHTQKEAASKQLSLWIKSLRTGENGPSLSSDDQKALKDGRLGTLAKSLADLCPAFKAALNAKPTAQTTPTRK